MTPTWCTNKIEYSAPGLETYLVLNKGTQTYVIPQISNSLDLSGLVETVYTVTTDFIVSDYAGTETKHSVDYELTIKNPCIDQTFVTIKAPTFAKKTYIIDSVVDPFEPEGEFTVET